MCSAVFSEFATARSVRLQHALADRRAEADRREASQDIVRRYREPLLLAAFDLQARLRNIVQDGFAARHLGNADPDAALRPGQHLVPHRRLPGWAEILRCGLQFLDLGEDGRTHAVIERLDSVSRIFANTDWYPRSAFRLFRDEQRAVGEVMLEPAGGDIRQYQCIGYATFVTRLDADEAFARWFRRLGTEISELAQPEPGYLDRPVALQRALIDVIDALDPDGIRLPKAYVKRLENASPVTS